MKRCERPGCGKWVKEFAEKLALDPCGTGLIQPDTMNIRGDDEAMAVVNSISVLLCDVCEVELETWWLQHVTRQGRSMYP